LPVPSRRINYLDDLARRSTTSRSDRLRAQQESCAATFDDERLTVLDAVKHLGQPHPHLRAGESLHLYIVPSSS